MRKVIVNSTPLIALCKINQLDILKELYGEIYIPKAVFAEVSCKNDAVKSTVLSCDWVHIDIVTATNDYSMYKAKLHAGEIEVMLLAQEHPADHLVIIDDNAARKTAEFLGLHLTGTMGVLIKAKQRGIISTVMPIVMDMEQHGIYFSSALKDLVRQIAKE